MSAEGLFREFRRTRQELAIVVDEYGGTAGLVSDEDLLGSLVGQMGDEYGHATPSVETLQGGTFRIDASMPVSEFAEHFGVQVDALSAASVGGLVIEKLSRIPALGDSVAVGPLLLTVERMDGPRVVSLTAKRT
jgi:magnesium and cobalt transporter